MRVAILYNSDNCGEATNAASVEDCVKKLAAALDQHGSAVELFPLKMGDFASLHMIDSLEPVISFIEIDSLSNFFSKADEYDLIHAHGSATPVLFSKFTETPVLLTLDPDSYSKHSALQHKYNDRISIVWTSNTNLREIPNTLGVIPYESHNFVDGYLAIYDKILATHHREDHRPWGYYKVLSDLENHKVKRIVVYPGKRLSLQRHGKRSEHWVMISGSGLVTLDDQEILVEPGQSVDIPVGVKHRIFNPGAEPAAFVEIQMGDYFGEDDIERFEDDFGRV
jgi:mannose-6-phosphate isomerase-like protein (cupin superfamily)